MFDKKELKDLKLQWLIFWAGFDGSIWYYEDNENNYGNAYFQWIIPAHPDIRHWFIQTFVDVKNGIVDAPECVNEREVASSVRGGKSILTLTIRRKGDLRKLAIQMIDLFERKPDLMKFVPAKKLKNLKIMSEF